MSMQGSLGSAGELLTLGKQQKQELKKENLRTSHNPVKNREVVFLFFSFLAKY